MGNANAEGAKATALYVSAFFDELVRWGVREVVVSPGSRSTPLAMTAYEMSCRWPDKLRLYMDVDERGAAFLALGMAKASGRPVALVCTSGTAPANYYPAVVEASFSRVPLVVLTGDRPLHAQGVGAVQTSDQVKIFGDYVRRFQQMPSASEEPRVIAYARQMAREACLDARGVGAGMPSDSLDMAAEGAVSSRGSRRNAGPVHLNFPFDEPLKPDFEVEGLFERGRSPYEVDDFPVNFASSSRFKTSDAVKLVSLFRGRRTLVLAGEGSCETLDEAKDLAAWARINKLPLLADPLSGLRSIADESVIDNYDNIFRQEDYPRPEAVIRFGRFPLSKSCFTQLEKVRPLNVVVDAVGTRDFNLATDVFVPYDPLAFAKAWGIAGFECPDEDEIADADNAAQERFYQEWVERNDAARETILAVEQDAGEPEGAYVRKILDLIPEKSCLFSANSMPIRALDTFYVKQLKQLAVLCNRAEAGIDGTVSTVLGAAQLYPQTTFITGDFTMLHDLNALALQREFLVHHGGKDGRQAPSVVVVLLNNNGGGIFEMLPQRSEEAYFERLFLVPQDVDFQAAAQAFAVPHCAVSSVSEFEKAYRSALGTPGITLIEVRLPLQNLSARYAPYQR